MEFEWDPAKSDANVDKHRIDFQDAVREFADRRTRTTNVTKPEHGGPRFKAVGTVDDQIVAVIFTDRGSVRRIISARRSKIERRDYLDEGETP